MIDHSTTMLNIHQDLFQRLLLEYITCFTKLDDCQTYFGEPVAWSLATKEVDEFGYNKWQPQQVFADISALQKFYAELPTTLPPLYESLITSYRWAEVDLQDYRLLANPLGEGLDGLLKEMRNNKITWNTLIPSGYLPFAKGPDLDFDPICFDFRFEQVPSNYRVVKLDHESLALSNRIYEVKECYPDFEAMVRSTINKCHASES